MSEESRRPDIWDDIDRVSERIREQQALLGEGVVRVEADTSQEFQGLRSALADLEERVASVAAPPPEPRSVFHQGMFRGLNEETMERIRRHYGRFVEENPPLPRGYVMADGRNIERDMTVDFGDLEVRAAAAVWRQADWADNNVADYMSDAVRYSVHAAETRPRHQPVGYEVRSDGAIHQRLGGRTLEDALEEHRRAYEAHLQEQRRNEMSRTAGARSVKAHFKTRDGWRQMKRIPEMNNFIVVPESFRDRVVSAEEGPEDTMIRRRNFRLVKSAEVRDHRTGTTTTEAWYEEE